MRSWRTRGPPSVTHAHIQHELADKRKRKRGWITNTTASYTIFIHFWFDLSDRQTKPARVCLNFLFYFIFMFAYKQNKILKGNGAVFKSCGEFPDAASLAETVAIYLCAARRLTGRREETVDGAEGGQPFSLPFLTLTRTESSFIGGACSRGNGRELPSSSRRSSSYTAGHVLTASEEEKRRISTCIFIYIYIKDTEQRFVLKPNSSSVWRGSVDQELGAQLSCKNAPCGFSSEQQLSASAQERLRAEK